MDRLDECDEAVDNDAPLGTAIVWEAASPVDHVRDGGFTSGVPRVEKARFGPTTSPGAALIGRRIQRLASILTNPTFIQLHGRSPMETSRIASTTVSDAADALGRSGDVEWGKGRTAGHLDLGPFRVESKELGQPRLADGVLKGHGFRRLRVTVAIYKYGSERCSIQLRPRYRRPRTTRRLRHCLASTHGAADRLRDIVLTVDFMPPRHATATVAST